MKRFVRWLLGIRPQPNMSLCSWCAAGHHIHDRHTDKCLVQWCQCGQDQAKAAP